MGRRLSATFTRIFMVTDRGKPIEEGVLHHGGRSLLHR